MHHADYFLDLYQTRGHLAYDGEGVTQLLHAWQCGQLALHAGAAEALQLAAWLHDVGHLLSDLAGTPTLAGKNDQHELTGADGLLPAWGPDVAEPVRLHVQAKRYLVAMQPAYAKRLSPDSVRSLALQGGPMDAQECAEFRDHRYADDALRLRAWDELAKRANWAGQSTQTMLTELGALMQRVSPATSA